MITSVSGRVWVGEEGENGEYELRVCEEQRRNGTGIGDVPSRETCGGEATA